MSKQTILIGIAMLLSFTSFTQISFSNQTADLLSDTTIYSGCAMGIADMNGDSLDDIVRLENARILYIEYQQSDGSMFEQYLHGSTGGGSEWSLCIADVDMNGYNDILTGGSFNDLKVFKANSAGTTYTSTTLVNSDIFLQGSNFADIDNNGTIDIFACHDIGLSRPYNNDGDGNFTFDINLINTESTVPSDNSGNYGSIWTDYDNDGDLDMYLSKCRLGVSDPMDGRRINMLFQNDGNNNYTDVAEAVGLRPLAQSWATDFADIDNDGDLDCFIINHDITSQLYENNGDGTFTDITATSGMTADLVALGYGIQCIFDDFDNDCFVDLLVTSSSGGEHFLFKNNGNLTFNSIVDPFPTSFKIQSATVGDLNNDGFLDVYAGFANGFNGPASSRPDKLFINEGVDSSFFKLQLKGETCNINAIGTRVEIYGDWGMQVREIRSGESYGVMTSLEMHFGLGEATTIDSMKIRWPNGVLEKMCGIASNQIMVMTENNLPVLLDSDFTFDENDVEVTFTDVSKGIPNTWAWDFGDGTTSAEQNPIHTFPDAGPYTITLTISNDCETSVHMMDWELAPLPLDLLSFSATLIERDNVEVKWVSENEINFDHYELERSQDFQNIQKLVEVQGVNTIFQNRYKWIDESPLSGDNYYRLKQVDADGSFKYSDWVSIKININSQSVSVYPNPAQNKLFINTEHASDYSFSIINATGNLVLENKKISGDFEIDISTLGSGVYILEANSEKGRAFVRFIKL